MKKDVHDTILANHGHPRFLVKREVYDTTRAATALLSHSQKDATPGAMALLVSVFKKDAYDTSRWQYWKTE